MTPPTSRNGKMIAATATESDEETALVTAAVAGSNDKDSSTPKNMPEVEQRDIDNDNNDDADEDDDIFPPLEQSHMGSMQRDVTLALQLSLFAMLYGSTAHAASRAMRLLYVMLALMVYLPRIVPLQQYPASSRDTIVLVAMGGFLYWLVLTPTWLCHLLMVFGMALLVLQSQALWRSMTTSSSGTASSSMRPLLRTLHILTTITSIGAMITCLLLWPHYLSFHAAMDAYVLYAVAAVLQAKLDHIAATHPDDDDDDEDCQNNNSKKPSSSNTRNDDHHHSCTTNSTNSNTVTTPTSNNSILFSTNFAIGLQRQSVQQRFLLNTVIGSLILPLILSILLLVSCVGWPDAPWLAMLASLVLYSTLGPMWLLTTEPSSPPSSKSSTTESSSNTWSISNTLAMIWTMPLRIHVRSDASIVIEALANTIVYHHAMSACYHYYGKTVESEEAHSHPLVLDHKKEEDAAPTTPRRRRRRAAVRQQVVLVELQGSRFLRLAPEDPEGLMQAIHTAAAAAAVAPSTQLDHNSRPPERVIVVPLPSNQNSSHSTFIDVEMNPTR